MITGAGGIGQNFTISVSCELTSIDQNVLIPPLIPLPLLTFPVEVQPCPEGTQQKGPLCAPCDPNTFNFDGLQCLTCPLGAPP